MIVEVPFHYEIHYVPHRARNPKRAFVRDVARIEVVEATDAEAPVALRVKAGSLSDSWNAGEPRDYRYWNGQLWRCRSTVARPRRGDEPALYAPMPAADLVRQAAEGYGPIGHDGSWQFRESVPLDSLGVCRLQDSPERLCAEVSLRLQKQAEDTLFVEGIAYHRISEPVLRVETWGNRDRYTSISVAHVDGIEAGHAPRDFVRADRFDDAVAEWERRTGETYDAAERGGPPIEVLMPQVLRFRYDMRPRVEAEAESVRSWMESGVVKYDIAFASAYIRLRDALAADEIDHDAVARLVGGDVAQALRAAGEWDRMIDKAERLLAEWLDRDDPSTVVDADVAALAV